MGFLGLFIQTGGPIDYEELAGTVASDGDKLGFSSAYHPQTQGVVERMNSVVSQTLRCLIHESRDVKKREILLPTVEMVINSLPNQF